MPPALVPGLHTAMLDELREAEENPRWIGDERFAALKHDLAHDPSMLDARPLIADAADYDDAGAHAVVCGNMRYRAAIELAGEGDERFAELPVFVKVFDSPEQRREWMLRDNQGYGEWVPDELAQLVLEHREADGDLSALGFRDTEVELLIARATEPEPMPDPDDPPPRRRKVSFEARDLTCPECGHSGPAAEFRADD